MSARDVYDLERRRDRYARLMAERQHAADTLAHLALRQGGSPVFHASLATAYLGLCADADALFTELVHHPMYRATKDTARRRARRLARQQADPRGEGMKPKEGWLAIRVAENAERLAKT